MRHLAAVLTFLLLGGCASLPHDGPSARGVQAAADSGYAVVDLDYRVSQVVAANQPRLLTSLASVASAAPVDLIGEGDVLSVWVSDAGAGASRPGEQGAAQTFRLVVERGGMVNAPLAGPVEVAGLTPVQASAAIQRSQQGRAVSPQVIVTMETNAANTVTVIGEVRQAGRFPLSAGGDRLLDVLAAAGGSAKPSADVVITVARGQQMASAPLAAILDDPAENIRLAPRDQVRAAYKPRKFNAFGALGKASQVQIEDESLTLADALGRLGGLDGDSANAASVLLFRFERPEVARALGVEAPPTARGTPVIYRADLRRPDGYFVAGTFDVLPDDLIYAPRADSAELRQFFELVSTITRVAYDVTIATVIP